MIHAGTFWSITNGAAALITPTERYVSVSHKIGISISSFILLFVRLMRSF